MIPFERVLKEVQPAPECGTTEGDMSNFVRRMRQSGMPDAVAANHRDSSRSIDDGNRVPGGGRSGPGGAARLLLLAMGLATMFSSGCSILHPVRGVPASYLPAQFEGPRRGGKRTINPSLLTQTPPSQHRVAAGDVLSVYIPGVLGRRATEVNEVGVEPPINQPFKPEDPPTIGYPITVRDDHTISLPQIPPLYVYDKTIGEVELAIRRAYTEDFRILRPEEAMILVSLQRPRVHRILVVRQETGNELSSTGGGAGSLNIGVAKKGTARVVTLEAYENDVLHALAGEEGVDGLPGLDAENTIYIIRRSQRTTDRHLRQLPGQIQPPPPGPAQGPARFGASVQQRSGPLQQVSWNVDEQPVVTADGFWEQAGPIQTVGHSFVSVEVPPQPGPATGQQPMQPGYHYPSIRSTPPGQYYSPTPELMTSPAHSSPSHPPALTLPQQQYSPQSAPQQQVTPAPAAPYGFSPYGSSYSPYPQSPIMNSPHMVPGISEQPEMAPHWSEMLNGFDPTIDNPNVIRIPVRLGPGETPRISEEMITLYDGDIVFIESRETDVFYTGGLLGGGQYTLPREYDLGVLEAISVAEGQNANNGTSRSVGGVSALNRDVSVSASRVIILRTLPTGQRITIEVDLHKAMKYQHENIVVQPGDMLLLQYTKGEAVAACFQRYLLEGALFSLAAAQFQTGQ